MMISERVVVTVWVAVMVVATLLVCTAHGRRVFVGGNDRWKPGVNYTIWASQETLYVGDWLDFWFDKNYYDVLEVNQTNYENCNPKDFITNITRGGRDVYELKEARPYYFICSKGYCYGGMKVAINVSEPPPPASSPEGNDAASLLSKGNEGTLAVLVFAISVLVFLIKV